MKEQPPKYATKFLRWYCREDFIDEIEGDLIEIFEQQYKETPRRANWIFIWQVLLHFRPDFIKSFSNHPLIYPGMLKHNFVVTSRTLAIQLFGTDKDIIDKSLEWEHIGYDGVFQISGIFEDPPSRSTKKFDLLFHLDLLADNDPYAREWNGSYVKTYVVLKEGSDLAQFNAKIKDLMRVKLPQNNHSKLFAQGYSDRYLYGQYENGVAVGGRIAYVRLFSIIALFILLIACVNFMNLSTAKASVKMKEIGVKKTIGATRGNLISQFSVKASN